MEGKREDGGWGGERGMSKHLKVTLLDSEWEELKGKLDMDRFGVIQWFLRTLVRKYLKGEIKIG